MEIAIGRKNGEERLCLFRDCRKKNLVLRFPFSLLPWVESTTLLNILKEKIGHNSFSTETSVSPVLSDLEKSTSSEYVNKGL
jgi:hypothetical protein